MNKQLTEILEECQKYADAANERVRRRVAAEQAINAYIAEREQEFYWKGYKDGRTTQAAEDLQKLAEVIGEDEDIVNGRNQVEPIPNIRNDLRRQQRRRAGL